MDATMRLITATVLMLSDERAPDRRLLKAGRGTERGPEVSPTGLEVPGLSKPPPDKPSQGPAGATSTAASGPASRLSRDGKTTRRGATGSDGNITRDLIAIVIREANRR
jgi:hypothetical protein